VKSKNTKVGTKVEVWAAFPESGAFHSGAEGVVTDTKWSEGESSDDPVTNFLTVTLDGSNDVICVHPKQCKLIK